MKSIIFRPVVQIIITEAVLIARHNGLEIFNVVMLVFTKIRMDSLSELS